MTSIVCRVCLDDNVKMHRIQDRKLVEMYETLSSSKMNTEDGLPTTICYICVSQLQRCRRFFDMARESIRTLTHRIHSGLGVTFNNSENLSETHRLKVTTITNMTVKQPTERQCLVKVKQEQVAVKEEPVELEDLLDIEESGLVDVGSNQNIEKPLLKESSDQKQYFYCDVCNTKCIYRSYLIRHMKTHTGEKPYACNKCNKLFNQSGSLKRHMHIHTGKKPYACNKCNKLFSRTGHLKRHMYIHTGKNPYACDVCKNTFTDASYLKIHMRIHTGEKPYSCDICNKAFNNTVTLKRHMLIHTGEKPYACDICKKTFIQAGHLKQHILMHSGVKPYACDICKKTFINSRNLKRHSDVHT